MKENKVLIIGGGVAGLSTGIYAQLNGFDSQILEMHYVPGGVCTAWDRKGFRFDYCLHWLIGTRASAFNAIWKETHVITDEVEVIESDIHNLVKDEQMGDFYIYTNIDRWQEYLLQLAPEDEKGIRKMCKHMKLGTRVSPFEHTPEARSPFDYIKSLFKMRSLLFVLGSRSNLSAKDYFKSLGLKNEKLNFFLHRLFCQSDFSALVVIMMLGWFHAKDAGYLKGGSLALANRMADRYTSLGGTLRYRTKVSRIIVENSKAVGVELTDGSEIRADIVISAADGHSTLYELLGENYITPQIENAYKNWELFIPFIQIAFGVDGIVKSQAHSISYAEKDFSIGALTFKYGYSILNQSSKDSTLAPAGKTTLVLRIDSAWEDWQNMTKDDYAKIKEELKTAGLAILEKHYPNITSKVEVIDVATPQTCVNYTGVWKGAYEGFMPTGNMIKKQLKSTLPNLENFYMVGQWMFPGGGLPPSAQSGKWIIEKICKEQKRKFNTKG